MKNFKFLVVSRKTKKNGRVEDAMEMFQEVGEAIAEVSHGIEEVAGATDQQAQQVLAAFVVRRSESDAHAERAEHLGLLGR